MIFEERSEGWGIGQVESQQGEDWYYGPEGQTDMKGNKGDPCPGMNVNGIAESSWREQGVKAAAVGRGQG